MDAQPEVMAEPVEPEFGAYLQRVRAARSELGDSVRAVEDALASPVRRRDVWVERVHAAIAELTHDYREHVELTEGEGGLYASIRRSSPRLARPAQRLLDEHVEHGGHLERLLDRLEDPNRLPDDLTDLREEVTSLIGQMIRHRQRGSDLVYEAWEVDVGGSE